MARIHLNDTVESIAFKMSEGYPGALLVIVECLKNGDRIDPDAMMGGLGAVLSLDTLELYGPHIWMLYKDVCGEDLRVMFGILRAWQLGFTTPEAIRHAVDHRGDGLAVPDLVAQVEARLPNFQKAVK